MGASTSKEWTSSTAGGAALDGRSSSKQQNPSFDLSNLFRAAVTANRTQCDAAPPPLPPIATPDDIKASTSSTPPPPPPPSSSSKSEPPPPPPTESSSDSTTTTTTTTAAPPPPAADSIEEIAASVSDISNPGPYEHASMDAKRLVTLDTYDGCRIDINKQLSPFMAVVHSFWLGTAMIPDGRNKTYTFLTQVADESGLLMARVDPERQSVDGRVHRALLGGLATAKLQIGVSAEGQSDQLLADVDFGGVTWTGNLKYGCMGGGIVFGCNFLQSVTSKFAMGGEGMYIAANQNLLSNYTLKYTMDAPHDSSLDDISSSSSSPAAPPGAPPGDSKPTSTIIANYNSAQSLLSLNYKRVVTPKRVTLGAELQCSPASLDSQVLVGAEFNLTRSKLGLCVDGSGRIQSILEAKLGMDAGSPTLNFAAELDHGKNVMRFGYGLNIGG